MNTIQLFKYAFNPVNMVKELFHLSLFGRIFAPLCTALIVYLSITWGSQWWEILSAVSGVFCVVLVADRKLTNFSWGLINCVLYGLSSYNNAFYGDMSLNWFLYVPFQFLGLIWWNNNLDNNNSKVETKQLNTNDFIAVAAFVGMCIFVLGYILEAAKGAQPFVDAINVILSITATVLMAKRYTEQWFCWILVNISGIVMWFLNFYHGNNSGVANLLMWVAFLINSLYGMYNWAKSSKVDKEGEY